MKIEVRVIKQLAMTPTDEEIESMLKFLDAVNQDSYVLCKEMQELYNALMELEIK